MYESSRALVVGNYRVIMVYIRFVKSLYIRFVKSLYIRFVKNLASAALKFIVPIGPVGT